MNRHWLMLICALLVGCSRGPIDNEPPPPTDTSFDRLPAILAGLSSAGEVLLYEGLPSEFWEPELRQRELGEKETIKLHGYPVHEETMQIQETDAGRLTALFSAKKSFAPYRGSKACGGFQPEFALEWKTDEAVTLALICLECGEVKLFGPNTELYCDLSGEVVLQLQQLLDPYRMNSPASEPP